MDLECALERKNIKWKYNSKNYIKGNKQMKEVC